MAAPGRGGRPRNAWNPSRCRKLVRLYTLTKLSKEEIQKVLAADDFNPCPRDIQSKLHALLPGDYGKSHRKYRPSDDDHMKLRFDYLRRCKKARISKERAARLLRNSTLRTKLNASGAFSKTELDSFEGCPQAFRKYSTSFEGHSIPLSEDLLNSQPVSSSMLLLDGSSLFSGQGMSGFDEYQTASLNDLSNRRRLTPRTHMTGRVLRELSIPTSSPQENMRKMSSLRGLGKQLVDKYSEAHLKHISSVLRYSSSNSWRSSLASFSSRASSLLSKFSTYDRPISDASVNSLQKEVASDTPATGAVSGISTESQSHLGTPKPWGPVDKDPFYDADLMSLTGTNMSREEQEIWNELVDEKSLECRPSYTDISPKDRKCCPRKLHTLYPLDIDPVDVNYEACKECGFSSEHRRAVEFRFIKYASSTLHNKLDFYRNTPLHCAAAAIKRDEFWKISYMIEQSVDVVVCNTSGETFLHVLCQNGPRTDKDIAEFLKILRRLSDVKFPLTKCDYHGRTILHNLFQHEDDFEFPVAILVLIFFITKPQLDALDNAGVSFLDILRGRSKTRNERYQRDVERMISQLSDQFPEHFQYGTEITAIDNETDLTSWLEGIGQSRHINRIDALGDTPLTAIIKCWRTGRDGETIFRRLIKRMIDLGAIIHMRDRNGDTALAIAARRGFRSAVTLLLKQGSNVHSRNYQGIGILRQIMCSMRVAQGDDRLWTLRYSCYLAMIDAGATSRPTDQNEWMMVPTSER